MSGLDEQPAAPGTAHEPDTRDFSGFTAPWALPGQDVSRASKAALDIWLESLAERPPWYGRYVELMHERDEAGRARWDWRKALYIAWAALPARLRTPATITELADLLGLNNTGSIRHWRAKDPEIDRRIAEVRVRLVGDAVSDLLQASIDNGLNGGPQGHPDRKMLLEIAGVYRPKQTQEISGPDGGPLQYRPVGDLSDEELARIATGGG